MGFYRGRKATRVNSSMVSSISITGGAITSQGDIGELGSFLVVFRHDTTGCGGPESGILVLLKDSIPWTRMSFDWEGTGTASCWSFMNTGGSNYGPGTGTPDGNMLSYGQTGDNLINSYLTWEVPAYQTHNRVFACDNDSDNFFRYDGGAFRKFRMIRTRNSSGSLAGIHHGRSCNTGGGLTIIKNIYIW
jgi:hypothetical protein